MLEAPWVLAAGMGEARSLAPDARGGLLVATPSGVVRVDGNGAVTLVRPGPAEAVTTHPARTYVLAGGRVTWEGGAIEVPGAVDVLAGWTGLLVLTPTTVVAVDPATGARTDRATDLEGARSLALGPAGEALVVTATSLLVLPPEGPPRVAVHGLIDARAAATDANGRVFVAADGALWRIDGGAPVLAARYLGDPRDLHFGSGDLLPNDHIYIATGGGSVDYLRPAP